MALRKDGARVHLIERRDIEARSPEDITHNLIHAFDRFTERNAAKNGTAGPRPSISKASPWHGTTLIRLQRPMAAAPHKGAFDLVQLLASMDCACR